MGLSETTIKKVLVDNQIVLTPEEFEFVILQLFKDSHRLDIMKPRLLVDTFCHQEQQAVSGAKLPKPPQVDLEDDFDDNLLDEY